MKKTKEVVLVGMFVAILAIMAQISIPLPSGVPITLQTFGIALCGALLGWKLGLLSVASYLLLGAIGIPIFSNMQGGASILFGKTGGFLWGFLVMVTIIGFLKPLKKKWVIGSMSLLALLITHFFGIMWFAFLTNTNFLQASLLVSIPFFVKDVISIILAFSFAHILQKQLSFMNLFVLKKE